MARSGDMSELADLVRLHFSEIYRGTDILDSLGNHAGMLSQVDPTVGDLDIKEVQSSDYFFS